MAAQKADRRVESRAALMVAWMDSRSVERKAALKAARWESQRVVCLADCSAVMLVAW